MTQGFYWWTSSASSGLQTRACSSAERLFEAKDVSDTGWSCYLPILLY